MSLVPWVSITSHRAKCRGVKRTDSGVLLVYCSSCCVLICHRYTTKWHNLFCNDLKLPALQQQSSLLPLIREFCTAHYCHAKIFEVSCYLSKLALWLFRKRGLEGGFLALSHLFQNNFQMCLVHVAWFPGSHSTVGRWKSSLWPVVKDQNPLHCHVKGLRKKFIQARDMLEHGKCWIIYLVHVLYVIGVCCKNTAKNQTKLLLLVLSSEKPWEM